jgi:hypothetical protein
MATAKLFTAVYGLNRNLFIAGDSEVINKIFYGLVVLMMILVTAWGGSWLYQAIFNQLTNIIS